MYVLSLFMSLCALLTVNKELFYIHRLWDILFTYGLYTEALNADIKWFIIHFAVIVFLYRNRGREQWWPHKSYTWFRARLQYLVALAMQILQSCTKSSIYQYPWYYMYQTVTAHITLLLRVMDGHLISEKPLSEEIMTFCQFTDLKNELQSVFSQIFKLFSQINAFENIACKTSEISCRPQCVTGPMSGLALKPTLDIGLTHWGRVTHICVGNLTIIDSDMACRLDGAKPLSKPMLEYCHLDP